MAQARQPFVTLGPHHPALQWRQIWLALQCCPRELQAAQGPKGGANHSHGATRGAKPLAGHQGLRCKPTHIAPLAAKLGFCLQRILAGQHPVPKGQNPPRPKSTQRELWGPRRLAPQINFPLNCGGFRKSIQTFPALSDGKSLEIFSKNESIKK